jgi:hypothetical protein
MQSDLAQGVLLYFLPRFVTLLTTAALAPLVPGVEDVTKGVARRQHWITVWLSTVTSAGAVR